MHAALSTAQTTPHAKRHTGGPARRASAHSQSSLVSWPITVGSVPEIWLLLSSLHGHARHQRVGHSCLLAQLGRSMSEHAPRTAWV